MSDATMSDARCMMRPVRRSVRCSPPDRRRVAVARPCPPTAPLAQSQSPAAPALPAARHRTVGSSTRAPTAAHSPRAAAHRPPLGPLQPARPPPACPTARPVCVRAWPTPSRFRGGASGRVHTHGLGRAHVAAQPSRLAQPTARSSALSAARRPHRWCALSTHAHAAVRLCGCFSQQHGLDRLARLDRSQGQRTSTSQHNQVLRAVEAGGGHARASQCARVRQGTPSDTSGEAGFRVTATVYGSSTATYDKI